MPKPKKIKIEFAPGAFSNFEGTQEELDQITQEILSMFEGKTSEEIMEMAVPIDIDELMEEDPEFAQAILNAESSGTNHTLQ